MKKVQKGFTLIELMIVVAIIGILAAIAIPQYQDYVSRSRWASAIAETGSIRTAIAECLQLNNGDGQLCDTAAEVYGNTTTVFPTTLSHGIVFPTTLTGTTGTAGTGGSVSIALGGTAAPGGCTVTLLGTVGATAVSWGYFGSGTGCERARTGFTKS